MSQEALADASSVLSRHAGTIVLGHLIVGALALSVIEGWGPSDSLYFCVTTLTTVGYGDNDWVPPAKHRRLNLSA